MDDCIQAVLRIAQLLQHKYYEPVKQLRASLTEHCLTCPHCSLEMTTWATLRVEGIARGQVTDELFVTLYRQPDVSRNYPLEFATRLAEAFVKLRQGQQLEYAEGIAPSSHGFADRDPASGDVLEPEQALHVNTEPVEECLKAMVALAVILTLPKQNLLSFTQALGAHMTMCRSCTQEVTEWRVAGRRYNDNLKFPNFHDFMEPFVTMNRSTLRDDHIEFNRRLKVHYEDLLQQWRQECVKNVLMMGKILTSSADLPTAWLKEQNALIVTHNDECDYCHMEAVGWATHFLTTKVRGSITMNKFLALNRSDIRPDHVVFCIALCDAYDQEVVRSKGIEPS